MEDGREMRCHSRSLEKCNESRGCLLLGPVGGAYFVCARDFDEHQADRRKRLEESRK